MIVGMYRHNQWANKVTLSDITFNDGTFSDGTFNDGTFSDGTFIDGTFNDGTFSDGTFNDGTLSDRNFNDGTFSDKTFNVETLTEPSVMEPSVIEPSIMELSVIVLLMGSRDPVGIIYNILFLHWNLLKENLIRQQALAIAKRKRKLLQHIYGCSGSSLLRPTRLSTHHTTRSRDGRSPEAGSPGWGRGTGKGTRRASWSTDVDFRYLESKKRANTIHVSLTTAHDHAHPSLRKPCHFLQESFQLSCIFAEPTALHIKYSSWQPSTLTKDD